MIAQSPPLFVGDVEPWWDYRQRLIKRYEAWHQSNADPSRAPLIAERVPLLFPPPSFSEDLAAGSRWRPAKSGIVDTVVVTVGGIYGGSDGPGGLFDYVAAVLTDVSFLQLDTGHTSGVAGMVLHAALKWLLSENPELRKRRSVILAGFSMGSATISGVADEFSDTVAALLIVSGQSAGTDGLVRFTGRPVLIIHGDQDPSVSVHCGRDLAARAGHAGAVVQLEIFAQAPPSGSGDAGKVSFMRRHHLWDERWEVQAIVLGWLRERVRENIARPPPTY
eukprot:gnl/TRDRNA2_/TRDRNA2_90652_c0_seq1.p1 gnl/TRDRNA2_/TRDRNA2_90652_c0~~gnl/TRDRNA2_/TRDRNA2_90652_c0_seq1.p1  ORF type:complete len:278 (+),score=35.99 gnl/TRDRNA2_/TRDRNA2_90652_c0_seq1:120-953(+)